MYYMHHMYNKAYIMCNFAHSAVDRKFMPFAIMKDGPDKDLIVK